MEKLSADALRLALVTASMEYYKKYVEGNQDFDNSEQIKEELYVLINGEIAQLARACDS